MQTDTQMRMVILMVVHADRYADEDGHVHQSGRLSFLLRIADLWVIIRKVQVLLLNFDLPCEYPRTTIDSLYHVLDILFHIGIVRCFLGR